MLFVWIFIFCRRHLSNHGLRALNLSVLLTFSTVATLSGVLLFYNVDVELSPCQYFRGF
jgi:hypothetical protein